MHMGLGSPISMSWSVDGKLWKQRATATPDNNDADYCSLSDLQLDEERFMLTTQFTPNLYNAIQIIFEIDWTSVQWEDLRKPFYSAMAAILYMLSLSLGEEEYPTTDDGLGLDGQASFWKTYYDTESDDGNRETFFKQRIASCDVTFRK